MNTLERFHIYNLTKENINMNDTCTATHNPIFDTVKVYYSQKYMQIQPNHTNITLPHFNPTHLPPPPSHMDNHINDTHIKQ
jgi:hypothetical protein